MSTDKPDNDAVLGQRLSAALRAQAESVPVPPDAWARFQERDRSAGDATNNVETQAAEPIPMTQSHSDRRHSWRAPLLAAAAVIAVALTTTAIATNGFHGHTTAGPAASASGADGTSVPTSAELVTTNAAGEVAVAFNASPDIYAVATASAGSAPASSLIESPADAAAAKQPTLWLKFTGGAPPTATLETRFQTADKLQAVQYDPTDSDGTPLGYLAHMVSVHGGPAGAVPPGDVYLWGVVGSEVAQVQIVAAPDSGATSAHWTFDSGFGTAFSLAGSETAPWVAMPDGYHAFAVHLSTETRSIDAIALGTGGEQLQIRRFDMNTGQVTDLPVPPPSAPDNAPPTTSNATPDSPIATTATGRDDASATGHDAPATLGDRAPMTPVPVPIETDYSAFRSDGVVTGPPSGVNPGGAPAFGLASIRMGFVDGAPPAGILRGHYVRNTGALVTNAMDQKSDRSPLGYVTHENALTTGTPGGGGFSVMTVWGAVPPDVASVTIVSDLPSDSAGTDASDSGMRAGITFVGDARLDTAGGAGSSDAAPTGNLQFTTIEGGYHGFVFQLPEDATWAEVTASGPTGEVLQTRRFG